MTSYSFPSPPDPVDITIEIASKEGNNSVPETELVMEENGQKSESRRRFASSATRCCGAFLEFKYSIIVLQWVVRSTHSSIYI